MTVNDDQLLPELPADCVLDLSHAESEIERSCERLRRLRQLSVELMNMATNPAQMCQDRSCPARHQTPSSTTSLPDGGARPSALPGSRDGGECGFVPSQHRSPCYGQHHPGPAQSNQHSRWVHCSVCDRGSSTRLGSDRMPSARFATTRAWSIEPYENYELFWEEQRQPRQSSRLFCRS